MGPSGFVSRYHSHIVDTEVEVLVDRLQRSCNSYVILQLDCDDLVGERLESAEDELQSKERGRCEKSICCCVEHTVAHHCDEAPKTIEIWKGNSRRTGNFNITTSTSESRGGARLFTCGWWILDVSRLHLPR
jgi:hypothetical protein